MIVLSFHTCKGHSYFELVLELLKNFRDTLLSLKKNYQTLNLPWKNLFIVSFVAALIFFVTFQGWTLALACSPRRVSKVSGERESSTTRQTGEYDFRCQEITFKLFLQIKLQNKHCFTFHFAEKIRKHNFTIPILQSFIFRTV